MWKAACWGAVDLTDDDEQEVAQWVAMSQELMCWMLFSDVLWVRVGAEKATS